MDNNSQQIKKEQMQVLVEGGAHTTTGDNRASDKAGVNYSVKTKASGKTDNSLDDARIRRLTEIRTNFGILFAVNIMVCGF